MKFNVTHVRPGSRVRLVPATLVAAGGIAVAGLIAAPIAAATTAQDICVQMGGSYETHQATNGKTVESCAVPSGGGVVTGYWIDGVYQGSYGRETPPPGTGNPSPPVDVHPINPSGNNSSAPTGPAGPVVRPPTVQDPAQVAPSTPKNPGGAGGLF